jgi:hypothetical protein
VVIQKNFEKIERELLKYAKIVSPLPIHVSVPIKAYKLIIGNNHNRPAIWFMVQDGVLNDCILLNDGDAISGSISNYALMAEIITNWPKFKNDIESAILDGVSQYSAQAINQAKQKKAKAEEYGMVAKMVIESER